jgi:hypothetical protein
VDYEDKHKVFSIKLPQSAYQSTKRYSNQNNVKTYFGIEKKRIFIKMKEDRNLFDVLLNFFPFQLLLKHLKVNLFALFIWLVLFLFISGVGGKFGVPFLFLSPEYLGEVGYPSFFILGFGFGGFVMSFNLYSYILLGSYFPFIATISRPFARFSVNNIIIPFVFVMHYTIAMIHFQITEEYASFWTAIGFLMTFFLGTFTFIFLGFLYFFGTNKDLFKIAGRSESEFQEEFKSKPVASPLHKEESWYKTFLKTRDRHHYYFGPWFQIRRSRDWMHYDKELIEKVFSQNHINASFFELFIVISFFLLGIFREYELFVVPAGASILLIFSMILMVLSAVYSWLKLWTYPVLITLFILLNNFSKNPDFAQFNNYVYGLNYSIPQKEYSEDQLIELHSDQSLILKERTNHIAVLENWKARTGLKKPKLILLNVSGGGARSALFSFLVMQQMDSLTQGQFSGHTQLITGASGGMIGAAYYRELLLRSHLTDTIDLNHPSYAENIGKDLLNQVSFAISTNDLFYRYQRFNYNDLSYLKDRGYAFEQQLHQNTGGVMEKKLGDYSFFEHNGTIPMMIFSPTVVNDGRRLIISSLPTGYIQFNRMQLGGLHKSIVENWEYDKLLASFNPMETRFSSVLRMNATFPYILPMVVLPGSMNFHVMDAGIRDNYGTKTTMEYIHAFKEWIAENTSGVLLVRIRDLKKGRTGLGPEHISMADKLLLPFGNMYGNFPYVQDFNQDELIALSQGVFEFPLDIISFDLRESTQEKISLSWHLTANEKKKIRQAIARHYQNGRFDELINRLK